MKQTEDLEINNYFEVHYFVKINFDNDAFLVAEINYESTLEPKEVFGQVIYLSEELESDTLVFREKKNNMTNSKFEFSKKGFAIPQDISIIQIGSYLDY